MFTSVCRIHACARVCLCALSCGSLAVVTYYTLTRFDGLFEAEWAKVQNMDFESTLETADTNDELPEAERAEIRAEISKLTGLPAHTFAEESK